MGGPKLGNKEQSGRGSKVWWWADSLLAKATLIATFGLETMRAISRIMIFALPAHGVRIG